MRKINSFLLISFMAISLVLFVGCATPVSSRASFEPVPELRDDLNVELSFTPEQWHRLSEENQWFYLSEREIEIRITSVIRELDNVPGIDEPAVLVNGTPIAKREIEAIYIRRTMNFMEASLSEIVEPMIRDIVALQEAIRLELEPSQQRIEAQMEVARRGRESIREVFEARLEGLGITEEEYWEENDRGTYNNALVSALKDRIRNEYRAEIREESIRRGGSTTGGLEFVKVTDEFFARYVDDLVAQATIEILDDRLK
jgi:hypothetical protein